jgi:hypothetical protein
MHAFNTGYLLQQLAWQARMCDTAAGPEAGRLAVINVQYEGGGTPNRARQSVSRPWTAA